jgi:hypothetical protein
VFISPPINTPDGEKSLSVSFGSIGDELALGNWGASEAHPKFAAAKDSIEFARLGVKRWQYYLQQNDAAVSVDDLISKATINPKAEIGFLLVAKAEWESESPILAIAWCRKTWCNHLILDFLACHPSAFDGTNRYQGVGSAMMMALSLISQKLDSPLIWGEATELSAGFYSKIVDGKHIEDHFFIKGRYLKRLQKEGLKYSV